MERSLFRRRKIPLLFLVGVALPSLGLGYLAVRGIRNELALQEQRKFGEHRALAALAADSLAARIAEAETGFSVMVAAAGEPRSADVAAAIDRLEAVTPTVEAVFFMSDSATIEFPASQLLFVPDGALPSAAMSAWPPAAAASMARGQELEFRQSRYGQAADSYRRAYRQVSDSVLGAEALFAVARSERKAGDLETAAASWARLASDFGRIRTRASLPFGLAARLEHGLLLAMMGDTASARTSLLGLYRSLVDAEWLLERAQFDFYRYRVYEALDSLTAPAGEPAGPDLADLVERASRRRETTERLLLFRETAANDLAARLSAASGQRAGARTRFALESTGQIFLVSLLAPGRAGDGAWGLLLDPDFLRATLRRILETNVDTTTTDWRVVATNGSTLLARGERPSGSLTLNATFAGSFPPWLVEFYRRPVSSYRRVFASGQSVYLYMFLLIASILVFGLVLTVRAVGHELELARLKSDFVSTVSHEFKSPLTSIRQMAEMLQSGRVPGDERRQRYYDVLVEQATRLSSLVTNILDLARIDVGRKEFRFEAVDIGALGADLVATTQHRVGHEGFTVHARIADAMPPVRADRDALGQAISNLIDNAILYSGDARDVNLHASAAEGHVIVTVEDFGVGIPADDIDRVFERFYRGGHELTRSVKGSGLGLTLVKEILEAHGGTVRVESEPGRGSRFSIRLPAMTERIDAEDPDHRG